MFFGKKSELLIEEAQKWLNMDIILLKICIMLRDPDPVLLCHTYHL